MRVRLMKRFCGLFIVGSVLLQGCPVNREDVQVSAANGVQLFLTELFAVAITQLVDSAFNVDG